MKDTSSNETTSTGNIKDRLVIVNSTYYDIDGNVVRYGHIVGETKQDSPTVFNHELFSDYKEARQYIREKYGI